tara:strand:- start:253 stop:906 length:654 start_codon:yes stop_codon:yes gene_type:complete
MHWLTIKTILFTTLMLFNNPSDCFQLNNRVKMSKTKTTNVRGSEQASDTFKKQLPGLLKFNNKQQGIYYDPLNLSRYANENSIRLWRESELMHGRVSMMAFMHFIVTKKFDFHPILPDNSGLLITHLENTPENIIYSLAIIISTIEITRAEKGWLPPNKLKNLWKLRSNYEPGDLGFNLFNYSSEVIEQKKLKDKELINGRIASLAVALLIIQDLMK